MRIGSVSALALAAFVLAACEGTPTTGSSGNNATLALCGLACPGGTPSDGINDTNNDGIDDGADGDDGTNDGGNTTDLDPATSDRTIALEASKFVIPDSSGSLSQLTAPPSGSLTTTQQILGATKPTQLMIRVDTNSPTNGNWATPVQMTEHVPGSDAPDPTGGANGGTDCLPDCGYREYRIVTQTAGAERNEVLQVWAWNNSYATQYRNATGGDAPQQAWSFGGNRTPDMTAAPLSATYTGRFVATAKTENWLMPEGSDINPNALWRVQGASSVLADFGTSAMTGTLTPQTWESKQTSGDYMYTVGTLGTVALPNFSFYNSTVGLKGTITGNTYAGSASLDQNFINTINDATDGGDNTNPVYGGFFGAAATETTGVFQTLGVDPDPLGGSAGINDDAFGYVTINGAFNGQRP